MPDYRDKIIKLLDKANDPGVTGAERFVYINKAKQLADTHGLRWPINREVLFRIREPIITPSDSAEDFSAPKPKARPNSSTPPQFVRTNTANSTRRNTARTIVVRMFRCPKCNHQWKQAQVPSSCPNCRVNLIAKSPLVNAAKDRQNKSWGIDSDIVGGDGDDADVDNEHYFGTDDEYDFA